MKLSKTRLSSWYVAPFLDNWLLDFSWVSSGARTCFSWNVNTFFRWFEDWDKLCNMLALSLRLQVTCFGWDLLANKDITQLALAICCNSNVWSRKNENNQIIYLNNGSFNSVEAFFGSGNLFGAWTANFSWNLLTFGDGTVLLDI